MIDTALAKEESAGEEPWVRHKANKSVSGSANWSSYEARKGGRLMTRTIQSAMLMGFAALIAGCAASVQSVQTDPAVKLRDYRRLALVLTEVTSSTSVQGASAAGIVGGHLMEGEGQSAQALNSLKFELTAIGFQVVGNASEAQLVGEFSIGQIRYDPLAGWIADQAILILKDSAGNTVAMFRGKHSGVTPTVNSLVSQIAKAVKKSF